MNTLSHFLAMGGYAAYVWPAYGVTLGVLLANVLWALRRKKQLLKSHAPRS